MASESIKTAGSDIIQDLAMGTADAGVIATDVMLDELTDALISHYARAASDIEDKGKKYFEKFKNEDDKKRAEVKSGKLKKSDYTKWRAQKMLVGDNYKKLQEILTSDMTNSNQIATDIINHKKSDIYALNHNYGVYEIEHSTGLATSYVLYDHNTVEHLVADDPKLLPKNKINIPADKKWNSQKINDAITQGVLQGEPIPDIAKRLRGVTDMNKNAAIRNARTAVTNAQSAGREASYKRAEKMGINMKQVWVSTIDGRTRHSHRLLMGEKIKVGDVFSNGLHFPGDSEGPGQEVYNCRCTIIAEVDGHDHNIREMVDEVLKEDNMTWDEWIDEQPLPKKTGETKAQYLARYSEFKKKQSFQEWLGMQAAPDEAIVDLWANKGWSKVFYEIYDKDHAAANAFKKELTALGDVKGLKPKDIWDQYLKGELDSHELNKFEGILKKHLGDVPDTVDDLTDYEKFLKKWEKVDISNNELPADVYSHLWDARGDKTVKEYWNAYLKGDIDDPDLDKMLGYKGTKPKPVPKPKPAPKPEPKPIPELKVEPILEPKPIVKPDITEEMDDKAKEAVSKIIHEKGEPMDFVKADNHNTNPLYDKNYTDSKINCQTCALTYEARRQGYDVIALPRNLNKNIEKLQNELSLNTRKAWIRKDNGGMVQPIFKGKNGSGDDLFKLLDKKAGTNGERYCIDFGWKKSNGGHIVNLDRDENGVLRLIDNQRGIGEKQIWVGEKEIAQYLDRVKNLQFYRVDDCIPNPKFFNKVCVKSSDVKSTKTFGQLGLEKSEKIADLLSLDMDDAKEYYNAWRVGLKKNKKLDNFMDSIKDTSNATEVVDKKTIDIMGTKFTKSDLLGKDDDTLWDILSNKYSEEWLEKFDGPDFKKNVLDKLFDEKPNAMASGLEQYKKTLSNHLADMLYDPDYGKIKVTMMKKVKGSSMTVGDYWDKYLSGKIKDKDLDDIFAKRLDAKNIAAEVESLFGKDSMSKVYNELKAIHGTSTANEFYNKILKPMGKQSDVWKKYVANELSEIDAKKIDDFLLKHIGAKAPKPVTKVDDVVDLTNIKKTLPEDMIDLDDDLYDEVNDILHGKGIGDVYTHYLHWVKNDINDPDLDSIFGGKKPSITPKPAPKPPTTSKMFSTWDEFIEDFKKNPDNATWLSQNAKPSKYMNDTIMNQSAYSEYKDVKKKLKNGELTNEEYLKYVIQKYGGDEYKKLKNDPTLLKMFEGLSSDMKISGKEIYRGLNMSQSEIDKLLKGGTIDMKGISSWSLSEDKATGFALSGNKKGVLLHDASGQQHEGLNIDFAKSKYLQDEKEVLLSPDEKWEVVGSHYEHKTFTNDFGHTTEGDVLVIDVVPVQNATKITNKIDNVTNVSTPKPASVLASDLDMDTIKKKSVTNVYNELKNDLSSKDANAFYKELKDIGAKDGLKQGDVWKKYLNGELDVDDVAKIEKHLEKYKTTTKTNNIFDKSELFKYDNFGDIADEIFNLNDDDLYNKIHAKLVEIKKNEGHVGINQSFKAYKNGDIADKELDDLFNEAMKKINGPTTPASTSSTPTVDLNSLKGKKMSQVYNDIKATDTKTANQFYKDLKQIGKPSEVWDDYLNGKLSKDQADIIEKHLIKKYGKGGANTSVTPGSPHVTTQSPLSVNIDDIKDLGKLAKSNKDLYDDIFDALHDVKGSPATNWKKYLNSELDIPDLDKVLVKHNIAGDKVIKKVEQQKKYEADQEELKKAEKALKDNVDVNTKWHGIWKDDVTVEDYPAKKSTIAAKKVYYEDELDKLENDPNYKSWLSEEAKNDKIIEMETYLEDLDEFEKLGKEYEKYKTAVDKARDKVNAVTPFGDMYSESRKNTARWAKTESEYKKLDKEYDAEVRPLQKTRTAREKAGYDHYTWGSGPFNQPLAGYKTNSWLPSQFVGVDKVDIDHSGYGDRIRGLTSYVEKSKAPTDFWVQSGQTTDTLDGMFGLSRGTISNMSESELKSLIGQERELPQFISGSINRGGGSYVPGDTMFNIYCPQGSEALYVLEDGHFGKSEHEMILQRGGTYKITNIYYGKYEGETRLIVDMELRLEKGYHKFQQ